MKILLTALCFLCLISMPAFAEVIETSGRSIDAYTVAHHTHQTNLDLLEDGEVVTKAGIDAPKLIKVAKNFYLGIEAEKDLDKDISNGYEIMFKGTIDFTLVDLTK